jgi:uncharacterized protein (TIGR02996 family)
VRRFDTDPHAPIPAGTRIAPHGEKTGDELLADVLADPASDDLRMVYADYLQERGDPRGELIALQLARKGQTARELELLAAHVAEWTQPLYDGLAAQSIRFGRGFLAACRTIPNLALRDAIGHPLWATVEELETTELALVVNPCLRSLRVLRAPIESVARLASASHAVPVEHLDLTRESFDDHERLFSWHWQDVFAVGALVRVRSLALRTEADEIGAFAPLLASPLGAQLERLELVMHGPHALARWCPVVRERPALTIACHGVTLEHDRVVLEIGHQLDEATLRTLQSFAGSPIRQLVISYPHDAERVALDAIVRRLASVFAEIVPQARWSEARAG